MKILIENEYGKFEIGGGSHCNAHLISISGMGPPQKELKTSTFAGQPGHTVNSVRDMSRTITMSFDFDGSQRNIEKLYHLIYYPVSIIFVFGERRRRISGICTNPQDVETIIFRKKYSCALQFSCENPYFNDISNNKITVFQRVNQFPNLIENEKEFIQLPAIATVRTSKAIICNNGEIEVYPMIHIYNQKIVSLMSLTYGFEITNKANGAKITLLHETLPDEVITLDLVKRKITSNIAGNITNKISDDTVLSDFVLELGENEIECISFDETNDISVIIEYTNNYASAVIG